MRKSKRPPPPAPFVFLRDVLPEIAKELKASLWKQRYRTFAEQVSDLRMYRRCPCGDEHCTTFYCLPPDEEAKLMGHAYHLGISEVMVAKGKIVCVDLGVDAEIHDVLTELFPEPDELAAEFR